MNLYQERGHFRAGWASAPSLTAVGRADGAARSSLGVRSDDLHIMASGVPRQPATTSPGPRARPPPDPDARSAVDPSDCRSTTPAWVGKPGERPSIPPRSLVTKDGSQQTDLMLAVVGLDGRTSTPRVTACRHPQLHSESPWLPLEITSQKYKSARAHRFFMVRDAACWHGQVARNAYKPPEASLGHRWVLLSIQTDS
jgi:hypothetical protein